MDVRFRIRTRIERPVAQVFKAMTDEKEIVRYFARSATRALGPNASVRWGWSSSFEQEVAVREFVENSKVVFGWKAHNPTSNPGAFLDYGTEVTFEFSALDADATLVTVSERGWHSDQVGLDSSYAHCQGWQHMLSCLKAYLEFGIDLRGKHAA